jgi:hypothetical protein
MPNGLSFPFRFGMYRRRTGWGWYVPAANSCPSRTISSGVMSSITCPSTPGVFAPLFLAMRCLAITKNGSWRKSRYSRSKRRVLSSFASFSRCPSSRITSTIRSITSVRYSTWTAKPLALRPVVGFPNLPGWSSLHRLLWLVCPTCACYCPSQPPHTRKVRWIPGSCLVTGMGSG